MQSRSVTPCSATSEQSACGSRCDSSSAITRVPPCESVQKMTATELSNERLGISRNRPGRSL